MLGFTVRSFANVPINTAFVRNGHDLIKVRHPQLGFVARTGTGDMVVLLGKTPVHVAEKPTRNMDAATLVAELEQIQRMRS